jgi:hypothetical protein
MAQRFAASLFLSASVVLLAGGPASAQPASRVANRSVTVMPAIVLERIETLLLSLDADEERQPYVSQLTGALALADGRMPARPAVTTLAEELVIGLAPAFVDDELAERLAYDLYALLATRPAPREAGVLVADVTTLLRQAGVEPMAAQRVLRQLRELAGLPSPERESPESLRTAPLLGRP